MAQRGRDACRLEARGRLLGAERVRALPLHVSGGGDPGARGPGRGPALRRRARRGSARQFIGSPDSPVGRRGG